MGCAECGFSYESVAVDEIGSRLRALGPAFAEALAGADLAAAARRPAPLVWSAAEYACHMRDVLLVQRDRAVRALVEDRPDLTPMHRDERVALCHYAAEPLPAVLGQLAMAAQLCAAVLGDLAPEDWDRPVLYHFPELAERDLAWVGRHTIHEGQHHLMDIARGLAATAAGGADGLANPSGI